MYYNSDIFKLNSAVKLKNTICPSCGRIETKKENDFLNDYIAGNIKESISLKNDKVIHGIKYCAVCR